MNNIPNANNALLNYIDALLLGSVTEESDSSGGAETSLCLANSAGVEKDIPEDTLNSRQLQLLLFKSADIPLAMSSATIDAVIDVERAVLTRAMSKDGIVLWQLDHRGRNIYVVDAREIILPNGHPGRQVSGDRGKVHILMLKGLAYGLLCDDVGESIDIDRQDVEWRQQRPTRLWLAGMVTGYNHALLDEKEIIRFCEQMLTIRS